jgi:hypothetical protein
MSHQIALLLAGIARPFVLFFVLAFICLPAKWAVQKWFPEGRVKRALLSDWKGPHH